MEAWGFVFLAYGIVWGAILIYGLHSSAGFTVQRQNCNCTHPRSHKEMLRHRRFIIGGLIILAALSYIIYGGMQQAIVYFVTPSELKAKETASNDKFLRMGGMVVTGSLQKDLKNLTYRFDLADGNVSFPVFFRGVPPDLFTEGKGAVVEGRIGPDGVFQATTIMAKHAEEYSPHLDGKDGYPKSFVPGKESTQQ
jgi:cytochrome c-type biogenesis protein CcmE